MSWGNWIEERKPFTEDEITEYLITRDKLNSGKRDQDTCMKRFYLYDRIRSKKGISLQRIADMFNKSNHATIIHGIKTYNDQKNLYWVKEITREYDLAFITQNILQEIKQSKE